MTSHIGTGKSRVELEGIGKSVINGSWLLFLTSDLGSFSYTFRPAFLTIQHSRERLQLN